ncbi:MAG: aldehyde dehydrogenase family protein [bacterium]
MALGGHDSIQERLRAAVRRNLDPASEKTAPAENENPPARKDQPPVSFAWQQRSGRSRWPADGRRPVASPAAFSGGAAFVTPGGPRRGLHPDINSAVQAASVAFESYRVWPLRSREAMIANIRQRLLEQVETLSRHAVEETGLGRVADKLQKNHLVITKTPGPEILVPRAQSGDEGLTLMEYAPFGVIAAITPVTNPSETLINNAISMLAGGNTVVFNAHPSAKQVTAEALHLVNMAAREAGCPVDPLHACAEPTIETAQQLMRHPEVRLLVVTGGAGVVKAALAAGKKVIAAGAGNPPAVVDSTADLAAAAGHIVAGASFDNNIVCIAEKVVVAEASIHDQLVSEMAALGCRVLTPDELTRVEETIFTETRGPNRPAVIERRWVGKDAVKILRAARVNAAGDPPLALALVPPEHPLCWTEQMMPVLPIVAVPDVETAIDLAFRFERNNRHTAMMHSRNIEMLSLMAQRMDTSIFIKNGSCAAGLGAGGEGYTSFTIASPTGEGLTTARTFCRQRRCVLVGAFRIV